MKIPVIIIKRAGEFFGAFPTRRKADTALENWAEINGVKDISAYEKKNVIFSRGVLMTSGQFGTEAQKKLFKKHEERKTRQMEQDYGFPPPSPLIL